MIHNIALVDDDLKILDYIKSIFKDEPYNIFPFQDLFEAIEQMATVDYAVVIVDPLMLGEACCSFICEIKKRQPETEIILMTQLHNYKEAKKLVDQVVVNPWDFPSLKSIIKKTVDLYEVQKEAKDNITTKLQPNSKRVRLNSFGPNQMDHKGPNAANPQPKRQRSLEH